MSKEAITYALRAYLPYGQWTCADGTVYLFNRAYKPIWVRSPSGEVSQCDPNLWVRFVKQEWFYSDMDAPYSVPSLSRHKTAMKLCIAVLTEWGVYNRDSCAP